MKYEHSYITICFRVLPSSFLWSLKPCHPNGRPFDYPGSPGGQGSKKRKFFARQVVKCLSTRGGTQQTWKEGIFRRSCWKSLASWLSCFFWVSSEVPPCIRDQAWAVVFFHPQLSAWKLKLRISGFATARCIHHGDVRKHHAVVLKAWAVSIWAKMRAKEWSLIGHQ